MQLVLRLIIGTLGIAAGIFLVAKSYTIVQKIGYNEWAEEHLGGGGTYTLVKFIGLVVILLAVLVILGLIPLPF